MTGSDQRGRPDSEEAIVRSTSAYCMFLNTLFNSEFNTPYSILYTRIVNITMINYFLSSTSFLVSFSSREQRMRQPVQGYNKYHPAEVAMFQIGICSHGEKRKKKARITRALYKGIQTASDSHGHCQRWKKASKLVCSSIRNCGDPVVIVTVVSVEAVDVLGQFDVHHYMHTLLPSVEQGTDSELAVLRTRARSAVHHPSLQRDKE